jgi:hypothetical protein
VIKFSFEPPVGAPAHTLGFRRAAIHGVAVYWIELAGCCARATTGNVITPQTPAMNCRRLISVTLPARWGSDYQLWHAEMSRLLRRNGRAEVTEKSQYRM